MNKLSGLFALMFLVFSGNVSGQKKILTEKQWLQNQIEIIAGKDMHGRGYVLGGKDTAAKYILKKFKEFKLQPIVKDGPMAQAFDFPVNTFPGKVELKINETRLSPGVDFMIDAASSSFAADNMVLTTIDLKKVDDTAKWNKIVASFEVNHAYCFEHLEKYCEAVELRKDKFVKMLPKGVFIIPKDDKLMWTVSREAMEATVFYVKSEALPGKMKTLSVQVDAVFEPKMRSENLVGMLPGTVTDSYIVFSAHYDHLGMMGDSATFPGASDNASGTAMLLSLANYFSKHPTKYSILFISFAGEEAGLLGSEWFVWHPMVPLVNIKFLMNIDIMGDASRGVTVVNATEQPNEFSSLLAINEKMQYLPEIKSRGQAANSDHYHFAKAGVPALFMYSNGGNGYYHDVFDLPSEVTLNNIGSVTKLLIDFVSNLN
jgi:hypothetical protein